MKVRLDILQTFGFGFRIDFRYPRWIEINFLNLSLFIAQIFKKASEK